MAFGNPFNTTPATVRRYPNPVEVAPGSFEVGARLYNPDEEFALSRRRDAMEGLREAAGMERELRTADRGANLADARRFGLDEADVLEDVNDFTVERQIPRQDRLSEAAAGREFLPFANQLYRRNRGASMEDFQRRYVDPATIKSEADLGTAELIRQGQVQAAQIGAGSGVQRAMLEGILRAIQESIQQSPGGKFNPENVQGITPDLLARMLMRRRGGEGQGQ